MIPRSLLLGVAVFVLSMAWLPAAAGAQGRRIAILLDTSRSMQNNDARRYTAQITKILADVARPDDEVTVIRMPRQGLIDAFLTGPAETCSSPASSSLARRHQGTDTTGFKQQVDALVSYDTGTYFASAIRTAVQALSLDRSRERMLVIVADSGGLGDCAGPLTRELALLHDSGAVVSAVNLGGAGAFGGNPAFDFTVGAHDSHGIVNAVAEIYQRFLGSKRVQTGRVDGLVEVTIDPHVSEAYVVVAADGPLDHLEQGSGNPRAAEIDLDHLGGGTTTGLDGVPRGYRIVRLKAPGPGRWRFRAPGLGGTAGWLLLQESAIGVRMVTPGEAALGVPTPVEVELYSEVTGRRIDEPCDLPGMEITATVGGRRQRLSDGGTEGDRQAGDCVFTTLATFGQAGRQDLSVALETDTLQRTFHLSTDVVERAWRIEPEVPETAEAGTPVTIRARAEPVVPGAAAEPPSAVVVKSGGEEVAVLEDSGENEDESAGDGSYAGSFVPDAPSGLRLDFEAVGGGSAVSGRAELEVVGFLRLADPPPVRFEPLSSGEEATALLDLSESRAEGSYELRLTSDYRGDRTVLEIDTGDGWRQLSDSGVTLPFPSGGTTLPLRLRAADCPEGIDGREAFRIGIEGTGPDGSQVRAFAPLSVEVVPDPWLECWWPALAAGAGLGLLGVVIHGFWSPSRFSRRLAVLLSPEEDMAEGFPHSVRRTRGSGSGFYRNATVFVCEDYRLTGRSAGALACLRADGGRVRIRPLEGASVWRRSADGEWERLPADETAARFGTVYRNDPGNLFFELRNG